VLVQSGTLAAARADFELAVRTGWGLHPESPSFYLHEMIGRLRFDPSVRWGRGWSLRAELTGSMGVVRASGESALIFGIGPRASLQWPGQRLSLFVSTRASAMTRSTFGQKDLGGWFAFTHDLGVQYIVGEHGFISCAFQHSSNARAFSENPGLDFLAFDVGWRF
jgi:hypothetical protein